MKTNPNLRGIWYKKFLKIFNLLLKIEGVKIKKITQANVTIYSGFSFIMVQFFSLMKTYFVYFELVKPFFDV